MKIDFKPNYPHEEYMATIILNLTKKEISGLYYLLKQAEPSNVDEKDIMSEVLNELHYAHDWIKEMEDIKRKLQENES